MPFAENVEGVNKPIFFSKECFLSALHFKPKSGDIFVVTYPKCGTTWMQNLVLNILRRGKPLQQPRDFHLASPFLDQLGSEDSESRMIRPGVYKTHLPLSKVPWSDDAKYIYVARNPKDCCFSYYNHVLDIPGYQFSNGTFDEFLNLFLNGEVDYNNYFDHLIPWYNKRNEPNVLFTTYEEMAKNLKEIAIRVASFIDEKEAKYLEENLEVLEKILHNCSFEEMRKLINNAFEYFRDPPDKLLADPGLPEGRKHIIAYNASVENTPRKFRLVREGKVRGWRKEFTEAQNDAMDKMIYKKTKGSDVMDLWKNVI